MGMQSAPNSGVQSATQGKNNSTGSQPTGGMSNFMQLIQGMLSSAGGGIQSNQQSGQGTMPGSQRSFQDPVGMSNPGQSPFAQGFYGAQGEANNPNTGGAGFGALQNPSTSQGGGGNPLVGSM